MFFFIIKFLKTFFQDNGFFSIQLLFTWGVYRILGFMKINILIRLVMAIFFFTLIYKFWSKTLYFVLNNVFFQYYLYVFLRITNYLIQFEKLPFYLTLLISVSIGVLFSPFVKADLNNFVILFPHLDLILLCVFLMSFINRLVNNVFYTEIKRDFIVLLNVPTDFTWKYIVEVLNSYLPPEYYAENRLSTFTFVNDRIPFLYYPFSIEFLNALTLPENNILLFFKEEKDKKRGTDWETEFSIAFRMFLNKRRMILSKYGSELILLNNIFYFKIFYGSISGYLLAFFYLNL